MSALLASQLADMRARWDELCASGDDTSSLDNLSDEAPSPAETPSKDKPYTLDTLDTLDGKQSYSHNIVDTESTLLQQQTAHEDDTVTIAAKDTELQKLSRELERARFKLDWSERRRQSTDRKLAASELECYELRTKLKVSNEITDSFNTIATLLKVKPEEVIEAVVQLKDEKPSRGSFVRWLSALVSDDCETRAVAAEARLRMYAEVDYPAQVRAAQEETKKANRRIEALASRLSAKQTALEVTQVDADKIKTLEETIATNMDKIKTLGETIATNNDKTRNLEHEVKSKTLLVSQLKEENTKLLNQLESARVTSESTEQTILGHLNTVIQTQHQSTESTGKLQALVDYQKKALADIQEELTTSRNDHSVVQQELEEARKNFETSKTAHDAFYCDISTAIGWGYYGKATIIRRIVQLRDESAAVNLALEDVDGHTTISKIGVLKTAREDLETANKELEDHRKDRDGIYKTLDVSSCLGAHLIIGDLKLAQLNLQVFRKAIGNFEDEDAVGEIERLQKREVELVKMESALRVTE
ncbi:hypothetical protein M436DRAFT_62252 [Aureobasidium namibiae CBS 147.97]|uniref:Uncharacterized protein n=1 Tax=Aureobasidium namibiae CBS 147.97 TaxID=1043004 RepID=A0A074WNV1_9PEZI